MANLCATAQEVEGTAMPPLHATSILTEKVQAIIESTNEQIRSRGCNVTIIDEAGRDEPCELADNVKHLFYSSSCFI
jgi:hypothetical protein